MAYEGDYGDQSIKGQKKDPGYKLMKEVTRPSAEAMQGGKARELDKKISALDMDTEATVDLRDYSHGSARLPKSFK